MMNLSFASSTLLLLSISLFKTNAVVTDICADAHKDLLEKNNDALLDAKNDILRAAAISVEETPSYVYPIMNYNAAKGKTIHNNLKHACQLGHGTVCDVNTKVRFKVVNEDDVGDDGTATTTVDNFHYTYATEIAKPLCVPDSCELTDSLLEELDPEPLHCEIDGTCEVIEHSLDCGENRVINAQFDCLTDKIILSSNRNVTRPTNNIVDRMDEECLEIMHGKTSQWCSLEKDVPDDRPKIPFVFNKNYDELRGRTFQSFEEKCVGAGAKVCFVDTTATMRKAMLYEKGRPFCLPLSCKAQDIPLFYEEPLFCEYTADKEDESKCQILEQILYCGEEGEYVDLENIQLQGDGILNDISGTLSDSSLQCVEQYDLIQKNETVYDSLDRLHDRMVDDCLDNYWGEPNDVCQLVTRTTASKTHTLEALTEVKDDDGLIDLENKNEIFDDLCYESGGVPCRYDTDLFYKAQNHEENIWLSYINTNYPLCLPRECAAEKRKEITFDFIYGHEFETLDGNDVDGLDCTGENVECRLSVLDDVCGSYPSASPSSAPTPDPTSSLTQSPTQSPTKKADEPGSGSDTVDTSSGGDSGSTSNTGGTVLSVTSSAQPVRQKITMVLSMMMLSVSSFFCF